MNLLDNYTLQTFVIPSIVLILPLLIFLFRKFKYNLRLALEKRVALAFITVWIILSISIYALLIFITGGINSFLFLEKGFFYDNRGLSWNVTTHINATLLTLPPVCTILPKKQLIEGASTTGKTASITSSMSAAASAFASTAVCCSTSVVAVVAPSVGVFLGPFVPGLLIGSFVLLLYSFYSVVMPRFPVISQTNIKTLPLNEQD
ncbi:MAG: hypothetical protein ACXAD7_01190 [Candidatus Kariarchaeaceae archaeon]|jgi:hypothetical protein